jgi:hypothetical protein
MFRYDRFNMKVRDGSVGIATVYGWTAAVRFAAKARDFSLLHSHQIGSWMQPGSYPMGIGGHEADRSPQSCADVKNHVDMLTLFYALLWNYKHRENLH